MKMDKAELAAFLDREFPQMAPLRMRIEHNPSCSVSTESGFPPPVYRAIAWQRDSVLTSSELELVG